MRAMILAPVLASLFSANAVRALPFRADADHPKEPVRVVDFDYWLTVTLSSTSAYSVGDKVRGTTRVYPDLAGPEEPDGQAPEIATYSWNPGCERLEDCPYREAPSFVQASIGDRQPWDRTFDKVSIVDNPNDDPFPFNWDGISLIDQEALSSAPPLRGFHYFSLSLSRHGLDFMDGTSLYQQFDVQGRNEGLDRAQARFDGLVDGVFTVLLFTVDRLRATPKVCRP